MFTIGKIQKKNPINKQLAWYPWLIVGSTLHTKDVVEGIVEKCTLTRPDIVACLAAFSEVIREQIRNGNSVKLDELGTFSPTITSRFWNEEKGEWGAGGAEVPTDVYGEDGKIVAKGVSLQNVKSVSICFKKAPELRNSLIRETIKMKLDNSVQKRYPIKP